MRMSVFNILKHGNINIKYTNRLQITIDYNITFLKTK